MQILRERIQKDAVVAEGGVLKVDSFLNHQLDIPLLEQLGAEFCRRFEGTPVTKVLTIAASGIAIAYPVARNLGVPLVFARKADSVNLGAETYTAQVPEGGQVVVSKGALLPGDRVLIIDDFLANGYTLQALIALTEAAEAAVEGIGIVIEKGFLEGGCRLRNLGYRLESLAIVDTLNSDGTVTFH